MNLVDYYLIHSKRMDFTQSDQRSIVQSWGVGSWDGTGTCIITVSKGFGKVVAGTRTKKFC